MDRIINAELLPNIKSNIIYLFYYIFYFFIFRLEYLIIIYL